jgi:hypothetical protein
MPMVIDPVLVPYRATRMMPNLLGIPDEDDKAIQLSVNNNYARLKLRGSPRWIASATRKAKNSGWKKSREPLYFSSIITAKPIHGVHNPLALNEYGPHNPYTTVRETTVDPYYYPTSKKKSATSRVGNITRRSKEMYGSDRFVDVVGWLSSRERFGNPRNPKTAHGHALNLEKESKSQNGNGRKSRRRQW